MANEPTHLHGTLSEIQDQLLAMGWKHPERMTLPENIPDNAFETDKFLQGYMPVYKQLAAELGADARICEVGVWYGGSLASWKVLFPKGTIVGVDIEPCAFWPEGTEKIIAAQEDPQLPNLLRQFADEYDIIIDDASHEGWRTAETFKNLWPLVRPGGYYVIEDWFYGWHEGQIGTTYTMVDVVKDRLDNLCGGDIQEIEEIRYRYGMCIMRKIPPEYHQPAYLVELERVNFEHAAGKNSANILRTS